MNIHSTAVIDPSAELAEDVEVGPYSVICAHVRIGAGTVLGPHVQIAEHTEIGCNNRIHQGAILGEVPMDKKFRGEMTKAVIGDNNIIREYVTMHRGTAGGGGITSLGNDNLIMCYVHIAHDCRIGNNVILSAYTGLAGHIQIEDGAIFAGMVGAHHFCRIGELAYVGGMSKVTQDIPPYIMAEGNPCRYRGLNLVGIRRNKLSAGAIAALKETYRVLFSEKKGNIADVLGRFKESEEYTFPEVKKLVSFVEERSMNQSGRYNENQRSEP